MAVIGQPHAAALARHEPGACDRLEVADGLGHRRRRNADAGRGRDHLAGLGDGDEVADLAQCQRHGFGFGRGMRRRAMRHAAILAGRPAPGIRKNRNHTSENQFCRKAAIVARLRGDREGSAPECAGPRPTAAQPAGGGMTMARHGARLGVAVALGALDRWRCRPGRRTGFPIRSRSGTRPSTWRARATTVDYVPLEKAAAAVEALRLLPAHEGRLLAGGRLRRGRRGRAAGRQAARAGGRRLYRARDPDHPDRGLRRGRRPGRHHRRHLASTGSTTWSPSHGPQHPGDRRDQRHLLARPGREVARLLRRDGPQGGRIPGGAAPDRTATRSRSRGSRDRPAPAGSRPATSASPRRSRPATSRSSTPNTATPARRRSSSSRGRAPDPSRHRLHRRHGARPPKRRPSCCATWGSRTRSRSSSYYFTPGVYRGHQARPHPGGADRLGGHPGPGRGRPGGAHPRGPGLHQARRPGALRDRLEQRRDLRPPSSLAPDGFKPVFKVN